MCDSYVYGLIETTTGQCFYVGKGTGDRLYRHVQKVKRGDTTSNPHLDRKIEKMLREGGDITYKLFHENLTEEDAFQKEVDIIEHIGLDHLCNMWGGGIGGRSPSDECRKLISQNRKGIPVSDEARKKMSEAKKGSCTSEDTKKKKSTALRGKPQTQKQQEANKQRSESLKGRKLSKEHRQKLREAKLKNPVRYWEGRNHTEETKEKIRQSVKQTHEDHDNE